jgi:acetylornithine deacetylase
MAADEEYASLGTEALIGEVHADAAIVTEPTGLDVCVAHKGFAWVRFETIGRAAHGSRYDEGRDAIAAMGRILGALDRLEVEVYPRRSHPLLGRPSVHASTIAGGEGLSTYPPTCRLEVERRMLPEETIEDVRAEMTEVIRHAAGGGSASEGKAEVFLFQPGYEVSSDAPIVKTLTIAAERVLGHTPSIIGSWPWMDSAILGRAGMPTVIFGPGGAGAHSREEYVELDSVLRCAQVLAETIVTFCGSA